MKILRTPRLVIPRVEHVPFTRKEDLDPRGEVSRRMRQRLTDVAEISGAVTCRNIHAATKGDSEMGKIAADALLSAIVCDAVRVAFACM